MEKTNEELFKQAINEALTNKFQRMVDSCNEEIVCSRYHKKAMRSILNGKTPRKPMTPMNRRVVAVLVAAVLLLLVGCGVIFRNEIREFITDIKEIFITISFSEGDNDSQNIEEIYELTYLPEGYSLEEQSINRMAVEYTFSNAEGQSIKFVQLPLDNTSFSVDSEHGDAVVIEIGEYTVYSQKMANEYFYLWNDGKYALQINSTEKLSEQELLSIINGIKIK